MTVEHVAAGFLIAVPILFNWAYIGLARSFDYPEILRREPGEILTRFAAGGTSLLLRWHVLVISALGIIPLALFVSLSLSFGTVLLIMAVIVGPIAAVVQAIALIRWPYVVPELARRYVAAEEVGDELSRRAIEVAFVTLHRLLGVAIGEHLGYLLTGAWTLLVAISLLLPGGPSGPGAAVMWSTPGLPGLLGAVGIPIGISMLVGALEFVGPNERDGWKLAGTIASVGYLAWSLWLVVFGVGLFISPRQPL